MSNSGIILSHQYSPKIKHIKSRFGNEKLVTDTSLNKHYKSHLMKRDQIKEENRIIELIAQMGDKKAYNVLKNDFDNERKKSFQMSRNKISRGRKDYNTNYINLENFKEKLKFQNKLNNQEGQFMFSLMSFIGNRPKKVVVIKTNPKLDELSRAKFGILKKRREQKEIEFEKNQKKKNSIQFLFRANFLNNKQENNKKNCCDTNFDENQKDGKSNFNQTKSTNFGLTNYERFYNPTCPNDNERRRNDNKIDEMSKDSLYTNKNNNYLELSKNSKSQNQNQNQNKSMSKGNKILSLEKELNEFSDKHINQKLFINNYTSKENYTDSSNSNINKFKQKQKTYNSLNKNSYKNYLKGNSTLRNFNFAKRFRNNRNVLYSSESDDSSSEELNLYDKNYLNSKLNQKYKETMNEFLKKIKSEEKKINTRSKQISSSIYYIKRKIQNSQNIFNTSQNNQNTNSNNNDKNKTAFNFHPNILSGDKSNKNNYNYIVKNKEARKCVNKSRYSLPVINKIIYGIKRNNKDIFEDLQSDLLFEVQDKINKSGNKKRIKVNGKEVIDCYRKKHDVKRMKELENEKLEKEEKDKKKVMKEKGKEIKKEIRKIQSLYVKINENNNY